MDHCFSVWQYLDVRDGQIEILQMEVTILPGNWVLHESPDHDMEPGKAEPISIKRCTNAQKGDLSYWHLVFPFRFGFSVSQLTQFSPAVSLSVRHSRNLSINMCLAHFGSAFSALSPSVSCQYLYMVPVDEREPPAERESDSAKRLTVCCSVPQ